MTRRVVAVRPETSIEHARMRLAGNRFSALPVVDDRHHLVGIVTAADLLPGHDGPVTVGAVMNRAVMSMSPGADVNILAHRLRNHGGHRAMPIVDAGVLVGIVTRGDLLRRPPRGGPIGRFLHRFLHRDDPPERVPEPGTPAPVVSGPLRVCDVMTGRAGLVTVTERTPAERARQLLTHNRFTALPVVDGDRLVGIVTEADLVRDPLDARRTPPPDTVGAAMTTDVIAAGPDTPVAALLSDPGPRLVPVVDGDRLVGVISRSDLLRARTGHAT